MYFYEDGFEEQYAPFLIAMNAGNQLFLVPFILMFLGQIVPLAGTIYLMHNCHDLMILMASIKMTRWVSNYIQSICLFYLLVWFLQSIIAALLAQYIEYFHYGGQGKGHLAGTCRKGSYKPIFSRANWLK